MPSNPDEAIRIYTSAIHEVNMMGPISEHTKIKGKNIKIFSGPSLVVARNGFAGSMRIVTNKKFTINDHAYVLVLKDDWKDRINIYWFAYQFQDLFWSITTSKSDNATFSKEYAEIQLVSIPPIEEQRRIMRLLTPLQEIEFFLDKLKEKMIALSNLSIE